MKTIALTLSASALMLTASLSALSAQPGGGPMMQGGQEDRGPMVDTERPYQGYGPGMMMDFDRRGPGYFGPGTMMGNGMPGYGFNMGPGIMGLGMMGHGTMGYGMMGHGMMRMMLILIDTDGDGAVSLEEFQVVHERMFSAMDSDQDGKLTFEEMENFMEGEPNDDDR